MAFKVATFDEAFHDRTITRSEEITMAEQKIGSNAITNMINKGLEELRQANIPQVEPSAYEAALDASARGQGNEPKGMTR